MAGFFGADVEQLQLLGRALTRQAEELDAITSRLSARIIGVDWRGPDARRFTSEWHDRLAVSLRATAGALRDASGQAAANARQQEEASGGSGSNPTSVLDHVSMDDAARLFGQQRTLSDPIEGVAGEGRA